MRVEKLARRDPHEALRDDSGGPWPPKNVIRRNWAMEKLATAIKERYSDELLGENACPSIRCGGSR